jgi:hypothetical protein
MQSAAEVEGAIGDPLSALTMIEKLDGAGLIDIEWLAHCPAFEVLRREDRFERALTSVHERAQALWTMPTPALPPA